MNDLQETIIKHNLEAVQAELEIAETTLVNRRKSVEATVETIAKLKFEIEELKQGLSEPDSKEEQEYVATEAKPETQEEDQAKPKEPKSVSGEAEEAVHEDN